jgi:Ni,Fe-hydrogenase III large subunit
VPQAHYFEREIAEQFGVAVEGHPALKPVRDLAAWGDGGAGPGTSRFFRVEGEEVHEVGVGPVHAGVIEPGHFRFQCHGERVLHLEIALGYQHRGIERAALGGPLPRTLIQMETAAGDTTIGHATAYATVVEALAGAEPPPRAEALRGLALELERIANHAGDLGALAADVAYLPAAAQLGRLRGDFLNLTAALCGSRFGRGLVRPGGVGFDCEPELAGAMREKLAAAARAVERALALLSATPSVKARFEGTGVLHRLQCEELGFVGPPARACGVARDVRRDHPRGVYAAAAPPVALAHDGDVAARAAVRRQEIAHSVAFARDVLAALPGGPLRVPCGEPAPESLAVALVEGWRGEICHAALTDGAGCFRRYKIVDPSFHNWFALALAMRGGEISDFPLCNKSFNLSYCGHDL